MIVETFLLGVLLSALYVEIMDLYPGGIIVPAYLALSFDQPLRVAATLAAAFLSLASYRFLSRRFILFGRRRFVMFILLGVAWGQAWNLVLPALSAGSAGLQVIGWVIPGLLANNLEKQKILPTLASLAAVAAATFFGAKILGRFGP